MMSISWDGCTKSSSFNEWRLKLRIRVHDALEAAQWEQALESLKLHREFINSSRLDTNVIYTPLHCAAQKGAPGEVVEQLVELGASRLLQNSEGKRPVDIAREAGHFDLFHVLEPVIRRAIPSEVVEQIQAHFHAVIRERAGDLIERQALRLPKINVLLEHETCSGAFGVPGMYGGFRYWFEGSGVGSALVSESWIRVVGNSGQRHRITRAGSVLVESGFE